MYKLFPPYLGIVDRLLGWDFHPKCIKCRLKSPKTTENLVVFATKIRFVEKFD